MTGSASPPLAPAKYRRLITVELLRSFAITVVLAVLYYLLPLDHLKSVPLWVLLIIGLAILLAVAAWQVREILHARYPGVLAIEVLVISAPAFLLLFAAGYFVMGRRDPAAFTQHLTRTDALYFTVTTFSTVGYGDIAPVSESARLVATVQMILDLLVLGLGIRVLIGAVRLGRQRPGAAALASPGEKPP
jgi:voltage-gated potassium channel